jgi:hypothetical protein
LTELAISEIILLVNERLIYAVFIFVKKNRFLKIRHLIYFSSYSPRAILFLWMTSIRAFSLSTQFYILPNGNVLVQFFNTIQYTHIDFVLYCVHIIHVIHPWWRHNMAKVLGYFYFCTAWTVFSPILPYHCYFIWHITFAINIFLFANLSFIITIILSFLLYKTLCSNQTVATGRFFT